MLIKKSTSRGESFSGCVLEETVTQATSGRHLAAGNTLVTTSAPLCRMWLGIHSDFIATVIFLFLFSPSYLFPV